MKLLRNPIVLVLLVVVALALVFRNVLWPILAGPRGASLRSKAAPTAAAVTTKPVEKTVKTVAATPAATGKFSAGAGIDLAAAQGEAAPGVVSPRRDPFLGRVRPQNAAGACPLAVELLTVQGIWMQPDVKLAVINRTLVSQGEQILEFRIEAIESDHLWVQGPNGRERVDLGSHAVTQTNRPPERPEQPASAIPQTKP
jgi:hypothetical protein